MHSVQVKNEIVTVRFHDEYCHKEVQKDLTEIGRIISGAYKRRVSAEHPLLMGNESIRQ